MALDFGNLFKFTLPRRKTQAASTTPTFRPGSTNSVLTLPTYRDHLQDLYTLRTTSTDARSLLETMFNSDPDMTAAVNAYLTVANTEPMFFVRDVNGVFSREAYKTLNQILLLLSHQADLTKPWQFKRSLAKLCEDMRYMVLLRGGIAAELVVDKTYAPSEIRQIDPATIRFFERETGVYEPVQKVTGKTQDVSLAIPTFFYTTFRASPLSVYPMPPFISAINTIAARQQIINDLYRIMNMTGYPRIDVKVLEDVMTNAAPAAIRSDVARLKTWINERIEDIRGSFANVRPDQSFVHTDSVEVSMLNDRSPGVGVNVDAVINVLNGQNQAGLKSVSTILGRGESGVNTSSVETRVFALNADAINGPVAEVLGRALTVALQLAGHPVFVEVKFRPSELRPMTELEPQLTMRQARLLDALSLGVITDEEFHIEMYGRLPPEGAPTLSGTGFRGAGAGSPDPSKASPNGDPLGRSLAPEGSGSARSNGVQRAPQNTRS